MRFRTNDSGRREEYASGMVRDTQEDKPDYTLIDRAFLKRWAELMVRGARKYGRENWRRANSVEELERFKASALRHMMQWLDDEGEEDHAAAVAFNIAAAEYVKGRLAPTLILRLPDLTEEQAEELKARWRAKFANGTIEEAA